MCSSDLLSIPTKDDTISTDVYLTEFLLKTVESSKYIDIQRLNRFPDDYYKDKPYTIFDILLNRRIKDLKRAEELDFLYLFLIFPFSSGS